MYLDTATNKPRLTSGGACSNFTKKELATEAKSTFKLKEATRNIHKQIKFVY